MHGVRPRAAAIHERGAELAQAGARVEDQERSGAVANLDARGVAAVSHGERPWRRDGAPRAPETDLHELGFARSRSERPLSGDLDIPSSPGLGQVCFIESSVPSRSCTLRRTAATTFGSRWAPAMPSMISS